MGADVIGRSGLGDELNFVPIDKHTLQSSAWENIWVIGDAGNAPTSKAGSVAHFMLDVLIDNILRHMEGLEPLPSFDGHANCFIESGFDIINPVQINAAGMDPVYLKEKYGDHLVFWGGGADTQKILPFAKPEEVKEHVRRECEILSKDGGFVFNTVHNIQANVPIENVVAMLDVLKEFR